MSETFNRDALDKLHAAAKWEQGCISCTAGEAEWLDAITTAWPAISARLVEYEEHLEGSETDALAYDKNCTKALQEIAEKLGFDWDWTFDGATVDELLEHVMLKIEERDARMKREAGRDE